MSSLNLNLQLYNNQEYAKIRDECLKDPKRLWEDTSYEASYDGRSDWEWKRPGEIMNNARFFKVGSKEEPIRFNLNNLNLGELKTKEIFKQNIAALSALTLNSSIFRFVVPDDNVEFSQGNYAGLFHFRFWRYGKFYDVVVDDRLPTRGGQLVSFVKDGRPAEFWPLLLDKAYTKLCGLAESLGKTAAPELLVDLTGGVSETFISHGHSKTPTNGLETILHKASERRSLIVFNRHWEANNKKTEMMNVYCITKAVHIDLKKPNSDKPKSEKPDELKSDSYTDISNRELMLKVFMPFITESKEWTGPWSENSSEWKSVPAENKGGIGVVQRHEFLISFSEFIKHDWEIHIVHLNPQYMKKWGGKVDESAAWFPTEATGKWVRGVSSGGNRREYLDSSFYLNPQFGISLTIPDDGYSDCTLLVSVLQKTLRSKRVPIFIYLFELKQKAEERFDWDFFKHSSPMIDSLPKSETRELTMRFQIQSGEFLVVTSPNTPQEEANFLIRVFAEKTITMMILNERVTHKDGDVRVKFASYLNEPDHVKESDKNVWAYFDEVSGESKVVGWKGLKKVLDFAMDNEKPRTSTYVCRNSLISYVFPSNSVFDTMEEKEFSKDLARSLLATADFDHSGKLTLMEFQGLWAQIRQWIRIYEMNSDENGFLPKENLREALDSAGFQLSSDILCSLAIRYSNRDNLIPFDDFLMCVSKLRTVFDYYRFKDPEYTDKAVFTLEEWLQKSIYS